MTDILFLTPEELKEKLCESGFERYRASQVSKWLGKGIRNFDEMTDLPKEFKSFLNDNYSIYKPAVLKKQISAEDGTVKYLWKLHDGNSVETVLMKNNYGNTVCISTQVGCRQGCAFCASTIGGRVRQLSASEILDEVYFTQIDSGCKISNIVLMGIGEPLDNYDNVLRFLKLVNHPERLNIGMRHISLSTCGLADEIRKLADEDLQITLSVSLHAPDNETRSKIMPVNNKFSIEELMSSCRYYYNKTGRRVSFEYAMIDGVNDTELHADKLASLAASIGAHVNLISLNYVEERSLKPSKQSHFKAFKKTLEEKGVNVTVRRKLGGDIDASCGQLRRRTLNSCKE